MSETVDVNILVYASVRSSPFHEVARATLERFAAGPQLRYLLWPTVLGYLRIVTDPRILKPALQPAEARASIDDLINRPNIVTVGELDNFWAVYRAVTDDVPARGKLVPDAQLVALMKQHGIATIWTHDRDFRKFPGITVRDPFTG